MKVHDQPNNDRMFRLLHQYWRVGVGLTITVALFLVSREQFETTVREGIYPAAALSLLILATLAWFAAYIHATLHELELLHEHHIVPAVASNSWIPLVLIMFLAAGFGVLIANVTNALVYMSVAIALWMANGIGFTIIQTSVARTSRRNSRVTRPIEIMLEYYLFRPFVVHQMSMLFGFFVAFVFAGLAKVQEDSAFAAASRICAVLTIALGEFVIWGWRRQRDRKLSNIER